MTVLVQSSSRDHLHFQNTTCWYKYSMNDDWFGIDYYLIVNCIQALSAELDLVDCNSGETQTHTSVQNTYLSIISHSNLDKSDAKSKIIGVRDSPCKKRRVVRAISETANSPSGPAIRPWLKQELIKNRQSPDPNLISSIRAYIRRTKKPSRTHLLLSYGRS
jgi:hypothetical protein